MDPNPKSPVDETPGVHHHRIATFPRPRKKLVRKSEGLEKGTPVALEASGGWYWFMDELEAAGLDARLVNPLEAKHRMSGKHKTDKLDAKGLAILLRSGTLPEVWVPPADLRDLRGLMRTRLATRSPSSSFPGLIKPGPIEATGLAIRPITTFLSPPNCRAKPSSKSQASGTTKTIRNSTNITRGRVRCGLCICHHDKWYWMSILGLNMMVGRNSRLFSEGIRPYRNKVVHDVAMGTVLVSDGKYHLVPRKERARDYGKMHAIQEAANDPARLKQDFVVREEQMGTDMRSLQGALNTIWQKPIADLCGLLYEDRNPILLQEYDIELVDE
jgi:hypothetical protein